MNVIDGKQLRKGVGVLFCDVTGRSLVIIDYDFVNAGEFDRSI